MTEFFAAVSTEYALQGVVPDEVAIIFELEGPDGGVWTLSNYGEKIRIAPSANDRADCHLRCTVDDFRALVDGRLDGRAAFMDGRVRVRGDVGLVLRLLSAVCVVSE
jgi:putative sterol carrier protein